MTNVRIAISVCVVINVLIVRCVNLVKNVKNVLSVTIVLNLLIAKIVRTVTLALIVKIYKT